jgi:cytochrome b involved in lipid metabolism
VRAAHGRELKNTSTSNPAGRDATKDFDEIGHSNSAKKILDKYLIGRFEVGRSRVLDHAVLLSAISDSVASWNRIWFLYVP